ncbi:hypothetical protein GCM10027169_25050 [Gordonia jinhuaensis]|uniref:Uncharacterized protein n=1 Tax=Gordonia jinhuaensis TaxID=1517702 RepID=A0A916WWC9_9ACTN|nr:hypothetical protein GCM10011489_28650 [Gordonia jinhuaensis]
MTRHRERTVSVWIVAAGATLAASVLYAVQIGAGIAVKNELKQTCHAHLPLAIAQYFWVTMLLAGIGLISSVLAFSISTRRWARLSAVVVALVCVVVFAAGWYGFSERNDWIGPLCSNL